MMKKGTVPADCSTYGSRRGNHEVMMRRAFAIVRIENRLADRTGRYATLFAGGVPARIKTVWEAAESYRERGVSLIGLA